jgi:hypothetical protein
MCLARCPDWVAGISRTGACRGLIGAGAANPTRARGSRSRRPLDSVCFAGSPAFTGGRFGAPDGSVRPIHTWVVDIGPMTVGPVLLGAVVNQSSLSAWRA